MRTRSFLPAWILLAALGTRLVLPLPAAESRTDRLAPLAKLVHDPTPRVRLEALRALAKIPTAQSAELALSVLDQPMDPGLDYALWLTINDLADPWITAFENGTWNPAGREKQLEFALKSIKPELASRVLSQALAKQPLTRDGKGPWIELIGAAGTAKELRTLLDQTLQAGFDDPAAARSLRALADASRIRKLKPGGSLTEVGTLLTAPSEAVQVAALQLAAQWKDLGSHFSKLSQLASAPGVPAAVRTEALNTLRSIGGAGAIAALQGLAGNGQDPAVRRAAVGSLAALDLNRAVPLTVQIAQSLHDENAAQELWRAVLPAKGAGKAIAGALPASGIDPAVARAGMRVAREGGRSDLELVTALAKSAGLTTDVQALTSQLIKDLAAKATATGDPNRGELVYRRTDLACTSCHAIGGAGGKVGPDMTSIGASAPIDYLVESVLLPNAKIKEGFHSLSVTTKDGTEYLGTLARETPTELVLRNAAGAETALPKSDVAKREPNPNSLMPAGLLENLGEAEQLDLYAFLSRLGKPGEFDASKGGVARRWYLANLVHTDIQNGDGDWAWRQPLTDKRWTALHGRVNGQLTRQLMEDATRAQFWTSKVAVYAATQFETTQAGTVHFELSSAPGAELWVDGKKVGAPGQSAVSVAPGVHRVIVQFTPQHIPDSLRLTSPDAAFVLN
jgi:putative heme-binding domain-containing protein